MNLERRIEGLVELGDYFKSHPPELHYLFYQAEQKNPWFSQKYLKYSIQAITEKYLDKKSLLAWIERYNNLNLVDPKTIGLILPGNIPLVGFHDIICIMVSGHRAMIKLSERDNHLVPFVLNKWAEFDNSIKNEILLVDKLKDFDAAIATGSDNSSRYFEYYFRAVPHIIRKNRNGVAIIQGNESDEELKGLGADIFAYYGLGCRNVSKIFVPKGYVFEKLLKAMEKYSDTILHPKYKNNFDYNYAVCIINKIPFLTNGNLLLVQDQDIPSGIGMVHYEYFNSLSELSDTVASGMSKVQCIVSQHPVGDIPVIPFGTSQKPELYDYADGVDTMTFLLSLNDSI